MNVKMKLALVISACAVAALAGGLRPRGNWFPERQIISDARVPWDPPNGVYGFFRWLTNQTYDTWAMAPLKTPRGKFTQAIMPAKIYATDMHGMMGFMIHLTDPDARIRAYRGTQAHPSREIRLEVMEVTSRYQVVFVNTAVAREPYQAVLIVVTSPHPQATFDFHLMGDPDSGFD